MNPYTLKAIVEYIRGRGRLPADQWGNLLPVDDMLVLLGLSDLLTLDEQRLVKNELAAMAQAQAVIDQLKANMP
jgi:hypothetical protein